MSRPMLHFRPPPRNLTGAPRAIFFHLRGQILREEFLMCFVVPSIDRGTEQLFIFRVHSHRTREGDLGLIARYRH